ncbi:MAG: gfo/Idh/MocA family oxidoreductase [Planctomycetota bacterium]|nr:MAG: gfo/Idh/MocA family oxidoreductase [Planctomycetota bacterium]
MSSSSRDSASEPVLIAGLGSIGRRHLSNLRALGCRQFIFYRTYQSTLDELDAEDAFSTSDLQEALARRPRIAIIANPTAKHLEVATAAARAGCHLLIEKPVSHSLQGCRELAEIAERNRLTVLIGCQFRFHPLLISLDAQLRSGRIGTVLGARAEWGEYLPDWHPWEDYRKSYSARADLGGGVVLTLIHPLDYLYWMFGPVGRVQAEIRDVPSLQTAAGDDWAEITLKFDSGVVGQVHLDYVQRPPVHRLWVWGDRGRATWDFHAGSLEWQTPEGEIETERVPEGFERNSMFVDEMQHFLKAIEEGKPSRIPLADGIAVLDIAERAKQSAKREACRA